MNADLLSRQVIALRSRVTSLFDKVDSAAQPSATLVPSALKELGVAMEELQAAMEELHQQNTELAGVLEKVEIERKRYQDLFQFAPVAYLVTSLEGCIQEANRVAAELLGVSVQFLVGKPLAIFINEGDRAMFRSELERRQQRDYFQEWKLCLQARDGKTHRVSCTTLANRDSDGQPTNFRWTIQDITKQSHVAILESNGHQLNLDTADILGDRIRHFYPKGELISLDPQSLWFVEKGLVKLTTLTEQNQELLIGLAGPGVPFGVYLTSLLLYEAMALSDVQLVSVTVAEIVDSPVLSQFFFVKTRQRLQQSERLLTISGERLVENRLERFLCLLKEEVGEPVSQGIRLSIRLTHEDLACACCTSRVTISRLMGQLQSQGKICIDENKHIIMLR